MLDIFLSKVCYFNLYHPVWTVYTGPSGYRYVDRSLSDGTAKIDRRRSILTIGDRLKKKKKKKKKRRRRRRKKKTSFPRTVVGLRIARMPSSPVGYSSPTQGDRTSPRARRKIEATSPARTRNISPCEEKDQGDIL
ncbi:hypothetical protein B296_00015478 [Ensete ventricosum]|uniref:Uncharacterized protein n=1 Tax=Ensete ventricosum TaxID=4639 RepID=A0A426YAT2_ENSVE|nr:hypothetical protein B296_00015478 [Ensete ventricosum]